MNKKGFTLVELISVIVILGIIALIVFPNVLSTLSRGKENNKKDNKTLIIAGAKNYVADNPNSFKSKDGQTYCITVETLYKGGYVDTVIGIDNDDDIANVTDVVKVQYSGGKFNYSYVAASECSS